MEYAWAEGFHAPRGIAADAVMEAVLALPEPSPEQLYQASKRKRHILHGELWSDSDEVWAKRGRIDRCRHILGGIVTEVVRGNRTIEVRAVEFIRASDRARWATMEDIRADPDLLEAYAVEVQRLMDQASAKHAKMLELMSERNR